MFIIKIYLSDCITMLDLKQNSFNIRIQFQVYCCYFRHCFQDILRQVLKNIAETANLP